MTLERRRQEAICTRSCKVSERAWPNDGAVRVCPSSGYGTCRKRQGRVATQPVSTVGTGPWATVTVRPL